MKVITCSKRMYAPQGFDFACFQLKPVCLLLHFATYQHSSNGQYVEHGLETV